MPEIESGASFLLEETSDERTTSVSTFGVTITNGTTVNCSFNPNFGTNYASQDESAYITVYGYGRIV